MAEDPSTKHFSVDARAILALGRDSIKDHTTAVLELVKNSYDARASVVVVEVFAKAEKERDRYIRISDNGDGMSDSDVNTKWLRIGYSEKLRKKKARGRRRVGEKGVGRLSADRLGKILELRSQEKSSDAIALRVDWEQFAKSGKELSSIPIPTLDDKEFQVPTLSPYDKRNKEYLESPNAEANSKKNTGTELTIRKLRQGWSEQDIEELHRELSILTPPFGGVSDFQIRLNTDIDPSLSGVTVSPFYDAAEIEASFSTDDVGNVSCAVKTRNPDGSFDRPRRTTLAWAEFVHRSQTESESDPTGIGPVSLKILFYPRQTETLRGTSMTLRQLREFLDSNAGIKVYRDNIRVMPYGDLHKSEGGDWLGLGDRKARNPAGAGRKDFRVAPNQVVGAVFLSRDKNPGLIDTSGREGLVHGDDFRVLKSFINGCIVRLESHYHESFTRRQEVKQKKAPPRKTVEDFGKGLKDLKKSLGAVKGDLPKRAERRIEQLEDQIGAAFSHIEDLQRSMDDLASQATIYRGLSSLGIATATFSHETDAALEQFLSSLYAVRNLLASQPLFAEEALDELAKAIQAGEKISAWGQFALKRIKPDKRRRKKLDVGPIIQSLLSELAKPFAASAISLKTEIDSAEGRFFPMDIESIALNLLTNAYYFCKMSQRERTVAVRLAQSAEGRRSGIRLEVADSGPGIEKERLDSVWEPLISSKIDSRGRAFGTGLGLSIVDDVVSDLGGIRKVGHDRRLRGALFTVWLPLE